MLRRLTILVALIASVSIVAWAATKGPDGGGYSGTDETVSSFVDVSGASGGVAVLAGSDDGLAALTLPFTFRFYGQPFTIVCVSSNGALYFVTTAGACSGFTDFANTDLSAATVPGDLPAVLPLWTDLTFDYAGAGAVYYAGLGSAGSRRFVVQWQNAYPQGSPNPVTFQAILAEGANSVLFQYKSVALGGSNPARHGALATVGIRNAGAPANQQQIAWSYNAPVINDDSALLFAVPQGPSCAANVTAQVSVTRQGYVFNPATQRFLQVVRLTNTSAAPIAGPFALVLDNLTANVTLFNPSGTTSCATPAGAPFSGSTRSSLAPGASISLTLQFTNPGKMTITYAPRVLAGDRR
jgi:hypothetical protein